MEPKTSYVKLLSTEPGMHVEIVEGLVSLPVRSLLTTRNSGHSHVRLRVVCPTLAARNPQQESGQAGGISDVPDAPG